MVIVGIVGSREYTTLYKVGQKLADLRMLYGDLFTIVSGGASGVDREVKRWCLKEGVHFYEHLPDFKDGYDVAAFHIRNDKIIAGANWIIAFWDGKSKGTKSVITKCLALKKDVEIVFDG